MSLTRARRREGRLTGIFHTGKKVFHGQQAPPTAPWMRAGFFAAGGRRLGWMLLAAALILLASQSGCAGPSTLKVGSVATTAAPSPTVRPTPPAPVAWRSSLPIPVRTNVIFEHLSLEQGLSQSVVNSVVQDVTGFLWIGTQDGLNRYDGTTFRVFKHNAADPSSLADNLVTALVLDHDGRMWVGTNGGLDLYDAKLEQFSHYKSDPSDPVTLSADPVAALALAPGDILWVGTGAGLNRLDMASGHVIRYQHDDSDASSLVSDAVTSLYVDGQDQLWVGTDLGLDLLDPKSGGFQHYRSDSLKPGSLLPGPVAAIRADAEGHLWVGTSAGLNRLDPGATSFVHYTNAPHDPASLSSNVVTSVFQDSTGTIWIGTTGGGVDRYRPKDDAFDRFLPDPMNPQSLSIDAVVGFYEDDAGILWVGTFGGGLDRYDRNKVKFITLRHDPSDDSSLSDNLIWSILRDSQNELWVATTSGGLNRARPGGSGFIHYLTDPEDPTTIDSDQVWTVVEGSDGSIWTGTAAGMDRFDRLTGRFTRYQVPPVFSIAEAADGGFWLGTIGNGLLKWDVNYGVTRAYTHDLSNPNSLAGNFVTKIVPDGRGGLWLGTFTGGLDHFDPGTENFTNYKNIEGDPHSLANNTVITLMIDSHQVLWVGTYGGLSKLTDEPGAFVTYDEDSGLPNATIYSLLQDDSGNLWLTTNRGLTRFDPAQGTFENYSPSDGLQSVEFNQGAAFKGADGEMYFGGINGLNIFHPAEVFDNPYVPPVVITQLLLFNQPVPIGPESPLKKAIDQSSEIRLSYQDDFLAFEFAALHFSAPDENQYAYEMEGLDRDWNYVGNRQFASYTGLPPGSYTFRVKASNPDGVWNEQGASLHIVIPPPFWRTWWFMTLVGIFVIGTVVGSLALRIRSVENQRKELARQVDERTSELQVTLTELKTAKDSAEAASRAKSAFLASVSHELRTPLNAIIGFSQLMLRSASTGRAKQLSPGQQENLEVILRSGEHLLGLVNDVLELSKIEAGRAALHEVTFDLVRQLDGLDEMFRLAARQKGLSLKFDVDPALPRMVKADEGKLRQVLMNLIGNAVKFTAQGEVALRVQVVSPIKEPLDRKQCTVRFEVRDTGPGIPAEELESIFDPFVQSTSGLQAQEGTGLGLAVSRNYARLMSGDVRAESELGHGSRFVFQVPLTVVEAQEARPARPTRMVVGLAPGQPSYRLLVVDDSETNRKLLIHLFKPLGFELREAVNGAEAIEAWEAWSPHLIWMDMRMPVMDGYEATRRIKGTTRGQATVIVALTASALEEDKAVILSEGCDDYVRKPFREEDLFDVLERHLGIAFEYEDVADQPAEAAGLDETRALSELADSPASWREHMRHAARLGYTDQIDRLLEEIRPDAPNAWRMMEAMARGYDHSSILTLLDRAEAQA